MFRGPRLVALSAALAAALLLTGCAAETPAATIASTPAATATPAFASKAEAFAAAEKVYRRYTEISGIAARSPAPFDSELFATVVTDEQISDERVSLGIAASDHVHGQGIAKVSLFTGQKFDAATGDVSAYVCVDYSRTKVLDAKGSDVTPTSRADTYSSIAKFRVVRENLLFDGESTWGGSRLC